MRLLAENFIQRNEIEANHGQGPQPCPPAKPSRRPGRLRHVTKGAQRACPMGGSPGGVPSARPPELMSGRATTRVPVRKVSQVDLGSRVPGHPRCLWVAKPGSRSGRPLLNPQPGRIPGGLDVVGLGRLGGVSVTPPWRLDPRVSSAAFPKSGVGASVLRAPTAVFSCA